MSAKELLIQHLINTKPRFRAFGVMREDYLWTSHEKEGIEYSIGIGKKGITARFLLRGAMKRHLPDVARVLEQCVNERADKTWPARTDRATVVFRREFKIDDRSQWDESAEGADLMIGIFEAYFVKNRQDFRRGMMPRP